MRLTVLGSIAVVLVLLLATGSPDLVRWILTVLLVGLTMLVGGISSIGIGYFMPEILGSLNRWEFVGQLTQDPNIDPSKKKIGAVPSPSTLVACLIWCIFIALYIGLRLHGLFGVISGVGIVFGTWIAGGVETFVFFAVFAQLVLKVSLGRWGLKLLTGMQIGTTLWTVFAVIFVGSTL